MTDRQLDHKTATIDAVRLAWEARLVPRVKAKVSDARAHADRAVTDAAKGTPDGRPTLSRLNRSPSYLAALSRLDELWAWLTGPSVTSLGGKVRDAREALYGVAAAEWFPLVPEEYRARTDPAPTATQVNRMRAAAVHGFDPRADLHAAMTKAKAELKAALERAVRKNSDAKAAADWLDQWEHRTADELSRRTSVLLKDSAGHADTTAGRDLLKPELIDES